MVAYDFQLLLKYLLEHGKAMQEHLQKCVADGVIAKWAVPEHHVFVEELPRTSVGKIDKKALRGRHQTGDLEDDSSGRVVKYCKACELACPVTQ